MEGGVFVVVHSTCMYICISIKKSAACHLVTYVFWTWRTFQHTTKCNKRCFFFFFLCHNLLLDLLVHDKATIVQCNPAHRTFSQILHNTCIVMIFMQALSLVKYLTNPTCFFGYIYSISDKFQVTLTSPFACHIYVAQIPPKRPQMPPKHSPNATQTSLIIGMLGLLLTIQQLF
jgi:hypothetical protein